MSVRLSEDQVTQLTEYLVGTTNTLEGGLLVIGIERNESDLDQETCDLIDEEIFECTLCGWWCCMHDDLADTDNGEQLCLDCYDPDED